MDSADYNPHWLLYLGAIVPLALVFDLITPISALKQQVTVRSSLTALRPAEHLSDPLPFHWLTLRTNAARQ